MTSFRMTLALLLIALVAAHHPALADEGMYPLSELQKLNLRSKGLKIKSSDIYSPGSVGLIDAIVQVGGCTGSFVSRDGLIITNHHCAFGIVQAASSPEHDYITDGYLARGASEELVGKGVTVRITESYRDASAEILRSVSDTMESASRTKAIEKAVKQLVAETEKANPGKRAEVSEMFTGKTYWLFVYTYLRDVRAVYVPPRSIGEFGGENDNWVWPRHTGDFSFLRAYVAPDGSPAEYSPQNVPYHPRKFLKVNPNGVDENDPVFVLGYPGRTFRHRTSQYLSFEQEVRMPYIADLYDWEIATMESLGKASREVAIKVAGRIKSLANVTKNYRGKLQGMTRTGLVAAKRRQEEAMQAYIDADPKRAAAYGGVLKAIGAIYDEMRSTAERDLLLENLRQACVMFSAGYSLQEAVRELQKADIERESAYMERNFARTKESYQLLLQNYDPQTDRAFLRELLLRASRLPQGLRIGAVDSIIGTASPDAAIDAFLDRSYAAVRIAGEQPFREALAMSPEQLTALGDPFVNLAIALAPSYRELREVRQRRDGALSGLSAKLVDIKQEFLKKDFIPDANSTLRLTFGRIQGYSPADALYASPITTMRGVLEKTTGVEPYDTPAKVIEKYKAGEHGRFRSKRLKDIPVAILYNLDTTGGNSGSPVLNAAGEVVGVNFDRAYEATINDYAWSADYSRSIGVDIRYVLWVTQTIAGADHLLDEMGIPRAR
jgi:hypothetical protein